MVIEYWVVRPRPYVPRAATFRLRDANLERHFLSPIGMLGRYLVWSETSPQKVAQDELKGRIRWRLAQPRVRPRLP